MTLHASIGKYNKDDRDSYAIITKRWSGTWPAFVDAVMKNVPTTRDKAVNGWVCGAEFDRDRRHGQYFKARYFVSLDYDHIKPDDVERVLSTVCRGRAFLAYTTWSHTPDNPRVRVWLPLSRGVTAEEYQAISRALAARADINLAARESFTPAQFMFRPTRKEGVDFKDWRDLDSPATDADAILADYIDWKDRSSWPHRADEGDQSRKDTAESPLEKPGIIGDFCRAISISEAISRFNLPYAHASGERWTYTAGSRPEGAIVYDDDTKLHSHHDTDPASGQHNAFDLVRLHRFKQLDGAFYDDVPVNDRPSHKAMIKLALEQPEVASIHKATFDNLDETESVAPPAPVTQVVTLDKTQLPERLVKGASELTDLGNVRRLQRMYGEKVVSVGGVYYIWNGVRWAPNEKAVWKMVSGLTNIVLAELEAVKAKGADEKKVAQYFQWAVHCQSQGGMAAAEKLFLRQVQMDATTFNARRELLTCPNGTVNLRTGELGPCKQTDFITSSTRVAYNPEAKAPRWERFLLEIFHGDASLVDFAQRWFGYCATGEVSEHALVFHVGDGGNGKGVLVHTLEHVLGPQYAAKGARNLLLPGASKGASPEITDLFGKRMVTLTESGQESAFDEALLKELSGGDRLKGRDLYEGFYEFDPTHKIQLFTNHKPKILGQDRGIWRRLFILPYDVRWGRADEVANGDAMYVKDLNLEAYLCANEADGILAWLVEGAKKWYADGLNPPASVREQTEGYRKSQDVVGLFLSERTVRDPEARTVLSNSADSLYEAYRGWATRMGFKLMARPRFTEELKRVPQLKYTTWMEGKTQRWGFQGLRLVQEGLPE